MAGFRIPGLPVLPAAQVVPAAKLLVYDPTTDKTKAAAAGMALAGLLGTVGPAGYVFTSTGAGAAWRPGGTGGGGSNSGAFVAQRQEFVATAGQTVFIPDKAYTPDSLAVYVNGVRLADDEFDDSSGISATLVEPCAVGDIVLIEYYTGSASPIEVTAARAEIIATAGQTVFPAPPGFHVGYLSVFVNGAKLADADFDDSDGASVVLAQPLQAGDILQIEGFLGAGGGMDASSISFIQRGAGAVERDVETKLREVVSADDFGAVGDGATDCTPGLQAAILRAYNDGGGEVILAPAADDYYFAAPVYVLSNVTVNLNGQKLRSAGTLFKTATVVDGAITPIGPVFDPYVHVVNARIRNGGIAAKLAFEMRTFIMGCEVSDINLEGSERGFELWDCFYSIWRNIIATPTGAGTDYYYKLMQANNAMLFERVTGTVDKGWYINTAAAVTWLNCTFEGGTKGFKFMGDCMAMSVQGLYAEAVPGTLFDFTEAGYCDCDFVGNYINYVDVILDDGTGGPTGGVGGLQGRWSLSNTVANIGGTIPPNTYRGLMRVAGARNYMQFDAPSKGEVALASEANWIVSKQTRRTQVKLWNADGGVDVRAAAITEAGITPRAYSGDVGDPYSATIPFSTIVLPTGPNVAAVITTQIKLRANASVVHFCIAISDNAGPKKVSGTIYGDFVSQVQGLDRPVTVSANGGGFLVLTISAINNNNGLTYPTGSIYLGR